MGTIYGAFGDIGEAKEWVNGLLFKTTKKVGHEIHGYSTQSEMFDDANIRGHIIKESARATNGEWVYSM